MQQQIQEFETLINELKQAGMEVLLNERRTLTQDQVQDRLSQLRTLLGQERNAYGYDHVEQLCSAYGEHDSLAYPQLFLVITNEGTRYVAYAPIEFTQHRYAGVGLFVLACISHVQLKDLRDGKPGVLRQLFEDRMRYLHFAYLSERHAPGPNGEWWKPKFEACRFPHHFYVGKRADSLSPTLKGDTLVYPDVNRHSYAEVTDRHRLHELFVQYKDEWLPDPALRLHQQAPGKTVLTVESEPV